MSPEYKTPNKPLHPKKSVINVVAHCFLKQHFITKMGKYVKII